MPSFQVEEKTGNFDQKNTSTLFFDQSKLAGKKPISRLAICHILPTTKVLFCIYVLHINYSKDVLHRFSYICTYK
jgi:hypothetical protein